MNDLLIELERVLEQRKGAAPSESYVASLHARGLNKILEKVGEEATEVILAAKDLQSGGNREALVGEAADLLFHLMVALSHLDVPFGAVTECLNGRLGVSGLEEKAARPPAAD